MPVSFNDKIKTVSPERREKISQHATRIVNESRLTAIREAAGMTQAQIAAVMGTSQANVSQIEKQEDPRLSTVRRFVEAAGATLEVYAHLPGKGLVALQTANHPAPQNKLLEPPTAPRPARRK